MDFAYIHGRSFRANGDIDSLFTQKVETKDAPLWHHLRGLSYTATGYGRRIPTRTMVLFNGKWRRVYICIFSNIGTLFIGKDIATGLIVRSIEGA